MGTLESTVTNAVQDIVGFQDVYHVHAILLEFLIWTVRVIAFVRYSTALVFIEFLLKHYPVIQVFSFLI